MGTRLLRRGLGLAPRIASVLEHFAVSTTLVATCSFLAIVTMLSHADDDFYWETFDLTVVPAP